MRFIDRESPRGGCHGPVSRASGPPISFGGLIDDPGKGSDDSKTSASDLKQVLVVDDDSNVASAMALLLEILGCEVAVAHAGVEAIELAADLRPAVAFIDIGMEGMDGLETARRLRAAESHGPGIMLVAVSGYDDAPFVTACREAGFDHHLTKPVSKESLIEVLDEV